MAVVEANEEWLITCRRYQAASTALTQAALDRFDAPPS
jgi:hypothetical protein